MSKLDRVRKLAEEWDHATYEREDEERSLKCYHESHGYWARPYAPCGSTVKAKLLLAIVGRAGEADGD